MEEKIFFNEGGVTVSNSQFVVGGQTYAMSEITSMRSVKVNPSKTILIFLLSFSLNTNNIRLKKPTMNIKRTIQQNGTLTLNAVPYWSVILVID